MPYGTECVDYKKLRVHDYCNYGRMIAINSLNTLELVEYFIKSLSDSYPDLIFKIIDRGQFDISIQCNDMCLYQGSYLDVEKHFRKSSNFFLDSLKDKLSKKGVI